MSFSLAIRKEKSSVPGGYDKYDIVGVFDYDWRFAKGDKAAHWIIRIQGNISESKIEELLSEDSIDGLVVNRRKWKALVDSVPQVVIDSLKSTGEYTTTLAAIKAFIQNKVTGDTL